MTTPLQALLDHAFAQIPAGLRLVREVVLQKARAVRAAEPEDATQIVILRLCASPQRTRAVLDTLAARNPGLGAAFESTPAGSVPALTPEVWEQAESQLAAYIARAVRNAAIDHHRKEHPREALPESDRLRDPLAHEEPSELLALRSRVLTAVENDASRPGWLDRTVEAMEALATGEQTMDELTAQCIAADASLLALPPETARIRARNRLQQQHQRARAYLIAAISSMITAGVLVPDEGKTAERWVEFLMRRQKRLPGPSRRSNP
jgi:DNA-directed RNA polymerase specialized sigma24 family protein